MAETLLRSMMPDEYRGRIESYSAGISAISGREATVYAQLVAREEGVDLSRHRATSVLRDMVDRADLILAMESTHRNVLLSLHPGASKKTYLLKEYASRGVKGSTVREAGVDNTNLDGGVWGRGVWDIKDPYGGTLQDYRQCLDEIKDSLKKALPRIMEELLEGD
jgi:protein-tyrosine phosphatase